VGTTAFWAYTQTLLPGVELGDSGGFQAAVLWPITSARRAYPLYYALAGQFVDAVSASNPARGLNLFSAIWAAVAVGLLAYLVSTITKSILSGAVSGLLLAFSYTFWTQAVIAEVYSLHLALVCACMVALHAVATRPTHVRLAVFFAIYAMAFGNHLSMSLLLLPSVVFLLMVLPRPLDLVSGRVIAMAVAIAALGALQYTANLLAVGWAIDGPERWGDRLAQFWFDTTKADWRETMVLGIGPGDALRRMAMWSWDAQQQVGLVGLVLAIAGALRLLWSHRPWGIFLVTSYAISTIFTLTYNVGDSHVFFLPGHLFTAFAAGVAVAPGILRKADRLENSNADPPPGDPPRALARSLGYAVATAALLYAGWRGWDTWPATDRHADSRGDELVARIAYGLDERDSLLISGLHWEVENALLYSARFERRELAWQRATDVMPHLPFLVQDNLAVARDVVLTEEAAAAILSGYGPLFAPVQDDVPGVETLASRAQRLPEGTPYVIANLATPQEARTDLEDLDEALRVLTGGRMPTRSASLYEVVAGISGTAPTLYQASDRPFRVNTVLAGERLTIRMDAWLPVDTFRRGGFGHAVVGRDPLLTIERGISFGWLNRTGGAEHLYAAGLYAPRPRFRISAPATQLAGRPSSPSIENLLR
jgi:hypothetical protein